MDGLDNNPTEELSSNLEIEIDSSAKPSIRFRAAGFWVRWLAFMIDLAVIASINAVIWNLLMPAADPATWGYKLFHINALFLGITGGAYFVLMTYFYQQTLGKMIMGIKVIQRSGDRLSWITVISRELVSRSLSQLLGLNLGYLVCCFQKEKRCIHDLLCDTWVVYEKEASPATFIVVK